MGLIITPDDLEFHITLSHPSLYLMAKNDKEVDIAAYVYDSESGLPRAATRSEMLDYMFGGEYEERLESMGYDYTQEYEILSKLDPNAEIYIDL